MSSQPGWYPDPAGAPRTYRWWDGNAWTQQTTQNPGPAPAPQGPGGLPSPPRKSRAGLWALLAGLVVLALIAGFVLPRLLGRGSDINAGDDPTSTVSGWDETSKPSPPPSSASKSGEPTTGGSTIPCPVGDPNARQPHPSDDRLHGGGISVAKIPNWTTGGATLSWTYDQDVQTDRVTSGWFSLVGVAALSVADGFEAPKMAARSVYECMASSGYYSGFTGSKVLVSKPFSLAGKSGWRVTGEVYVSNLGPDIKGDTLDIIVLDTGSPESLAMYMSAITIGDADRKALADAAVASMALD